MKRFGRTALMLWIVFALGMRAREYGFPFFRLVLVLLIVAADWQVWRLMRRTE